MKIFNSCLNHALVLDYNNSMKKIIELFNAIVSNTVWYNDNYWKGVTKFWNNIPFNIDVINLGSWPAVHDFLYDGIGIVGRNFALGPQSLKHDYAILMNYFSYLKEGGTVIIPICPFSGLINEYKKEHTFRYYTILHPATIPDFDDSERTKALMVKQNPFKQMPRICIVETLRELKNKIISRDSMVSIDYRQSANIFVRDWKAQFGIDDLEKSLSTKHLKEQQYRRSTLVDMVSFCKERNLKPVIVIPPMHKELSSLLSDMFYRNYIENLIKGIDAPVYNYMRDERFNSDEYFKNALFLNKIGAGTFTKEFLSKLGLCKLES